MPALLVWLGELIATSVGAWCVQALIGIGVGLVTYKVGVQPVEAMIRSQLAAAGTMLDYVGWLGIDQGITIVLSALAGRAALRSMKVRLVKKS